MEDLKTPKGALLIEIVTGFVTKALLYFLFIILMIMNFCFYVLVLIYHNIFLHCIMNVPIITYVFSHSNDDQDKHDFTLDIDPDRSFYNALDFYCTCYTDALFNYCDDMCCGMPMSKINC